MVSGEPLTRAVFFERKGAAVAMARAMHSSAWRTIDDCVELMTERQMTGQSAYKREHASAKGKRGSRGSGELGSPYPRLQRKFDLT